VAVPQGVWVSFPKVDTRSPEKVCLLKFHRVMSWWNRKEGHTYLDIILLYRVYIVKNVQGKVKQHAV